MKLADAQYFADRRDALAWRSRGLLALYGFGVTSLIAAVVTFIAHNWTYLGTSMKLGGLGAALIICTALWVIKGFNHRIAQSFGVAAQVLIGVWLAAAGQIYQAPGGLQDLLLTWAVLGLPFALASRSRAHWAVWFGIIWLAVVSPTGLRLNATIGSDWTAMIMLSGGVALGIGLVVSLYQRGSVWLSALLAVGVGTLSIGASGLGFFEPQWSGHYGPSFLAMVLLLGLGWHSYSKTVASTTAVLASAVAVVLVSVVGYFVSDFMNESILFFFTMTVIIGAATYGLVLFFKHLRTFVDVDPSEPDPTANNPWYMDALIGAGGILTAGFASGLIGAVIGLSGLLNSNVGVSMSVIGAGVYILSILMRRASSGQFIRFLFGTFIIVGIGCLTFGLGVMASEIMVAGLVLLSLSALTVWLVSGDRILSTLMAVTACIAIALIVIIEMMGLDWNMAVLMGLYSALALVFGTVIFRDRLHLGCVAVFFMAAILTGLIATSGLGQGENIDWALFDGVGAIVGVVGGLWLWVSYCRVTGPGWPVLSALIFISVILPPGAVPAMLLLILAYSIGSRALFLIGVIGMAWFLFSAYFDLSMTLMALSGVMAVVGVGLLGLWVFVSKRVEVAS